MPKEIKRFYVLSMQNDVTGDSYWLVRDRKLILPDQKYATYGSAHAICRVFNERKTYRGDKYDVQK